MSGRRSTRPSFGSGAAPIWCSSAISNTLISYLPPWSRERWSAILGERTGLRVANLGRDGWTLQRAVDAGYVDRALAMRPTRAVVAFGVNDAKGEDPEAFGELLTGVVGRFVGQGVAVTLVTTAWLDPEHYSFDRNVMLAPFNDAIRKVAADSGVGLADVAERMRAETAAGNWDLRLRAVTSNPEKVHDNVHFSPAGCRVVADEVVRALG